MSNPESIRYQASPKIVASAVLDETVILDYEAGKYFSLDGVGSLLWSALKNKAPVSLSELCELVMAEYDVDEDQCRSDLIALLNDLKKNGLIETSSPESV